MYKLYGATLLSTLTNKPFILIPSCVLSGDPYAFRLWEERKLSADRENPSPYNMLIDIWYTFCMDRTVRIQIHPTSEQAKALDETLVQFTRAFNLVCAYGWQNMNIKNKYLASLGTPLASGLPVMQPIVSDLRV